MDQVLVEGHQNKRTIVSRKKEFASGRFPTLGFLHRVSVCFQLHRCCQVRYHRWVRILMGRAREPRHLRISYFFRWLTLVWNTCVRDYGHSIASLRLKKDLSFRIQFYRTNLFRVHIFSYNDELLWIVKVEIGVFFFGMKENEVWQ